MGAAQPVVCGPDTITLPFAEEAVIEDAPQVQLAGGDPCWVEPPVEAVQAPTRTNAATNATTRSRDAILIDL